jgi:hypothetical protein
MLMTIQDDLNFHKSTLYFIVLHANHLEHVLYNLIITLSFLGKIWNPQLLFLSSLKAAD